MATKLTFINGEQLTAIDVPDRCYVFPYTANGGDPVLQFQNIPMEYVTRLRQAREVAWQNPHGILACIIEPGEGENDLMVNSKPSLGIGFTVGHGRNVQIY